MSVDPERPCGFFLGPRLRWALLVVVGSWAAGSGRAAEPVPEAVDWTGWGEAVAVGDEFGASVAGAGDVDGDGYPDVVVGSPDEGLATLFLGGPGGLSEAAAAVFDAGSNFGTAVAGAGDVNGDGYDDVILGATDFYDDTGTAEVFYGSADGLSPLEPTPLDGYLTSDLIEVNVAGAGDLDGDGYDDVLVGGYARTWYGATYVYYGSDTGPDDGSGATLHSGRECGRTAAGVGDVDHDGYDDAVVGCGDAFGGAYVYYGSATGLSHYGIRLNNSGTTEEGGTHFGEAVAGAGDVNADGCDDVIVGATPNLAYVFLGEPGGMSGFISTTLEGSAHGEFGAVVAGAGDVDGDGYDDVLVGATTSRSISLYNGAAGVLSDTASVTWSGRAAGTGGVFAGPGDLDGDGYDDVVIGLYSGAAPGVYIYPGAAAEPSTTESGLITADDPGQYGAALAGVGDVDGDGYGDVFVGASGWNGETGRGYLYGGGAAGLAEDASTTIDGESEDSDYGVRVAAAGDIDGDGYADVLVSAFRSSTFSGRAYLYRGSASGLLTTEATTLTRSAGSDYGFGAALSGAGDLDGDGYDDVLVGSSSALRRGTGDYYIYYGAADGPATDPGTTLTSDGAAFSAVTAEAGDVNGDGYGDLITRAHSATSGEYEVLIFHGSGDGPAASADAALVATSSDGYASALAGAGDVNGDGYADVIVGVCPSDVTTTAGAAVVYLGSVDGLLDASAETLAASTFDEGYGCAVGGGGDLDGDGYDDVAVGAYGYDDGAGRAEAWPGSADGVGSDGRSFFGATHDDAFGAALTIAPDVNGDGYDELLIGAPSARGVGCAFLYLGDMIFWAPGGVVGSGDTGGADEPGDGCSAAPWSTTGEGDTGEVGDSGSGGETGEVDDSDVPAETGESADSAATDSAAPVDSTPPDSSGEVPGTGDGGGCTSGKSGEGACASGGGGRLGWALLPVLLFVRRRKSTPT